MACRISELVIDATDPGRLAAFWSEVLGYVELSRTAYRGRRAHRDRGQLGSVPVLVRLQLLYTQYPWLSMTLR
jgi:Glyoxalase-like domain